MEFQFGIPCFVGMDLGTVYYSSFLYLDVEKH